MTISQPHRAQAEGHNSYSSSSGGSGFHYDVSLAGRGGYKLVCYGEL
jgi:hypothetical protein